MIAKTVEGYRFGGYSDQSWGGQGYKSSSSSFLFSLKCHAGLSPTKMKVKSGKEGNAINIQQRYGPIFGVNHDVWFGVNGSMKKGYFYLNDTYEVPSGVSKTFLTGKSGRDKSFSIEEVEVFEV